MGWPNNAIGLPKGEVTVSFYGECLGIVMLAKLADKQDTSSSRGLTSDLFP